jgi:hypothetical protein
LPRVFASAARRQAFPPIVVLSWNWSLVQSAAPATYRPHWFCEPTTPLAAAPVLWVSATDAAGGRFRSPGSYLSASSTFLQSLDHPTLAVPPQRGSTSRELSRPSAHAVRRVHYDGLCLPAGSAFRVCLPSWRFSPRRALPTLFQIGSAHGIHPSELTPRNGRRGISAALTHVPLVLGASTRPKAYGDAKNTGFWALVPPRVPCGWAEPLSPVAAGGSLGFRPSRGFSPLGLPRPSPRLLLRAWRLGRRWPPEPRAPESIDHRAASRHVAVPDPFWGSCTFPRPDVRASGNPGYEFTSPGTHHYW